LVDAGNKEEVASRLAAKRWHSHSKEKLVDLREGTASTQ